MAAIGVSVSMGAGVGTVGCSTGGGVAVGGDEGGAGGPELPGAIVGLADGGRDDGGGEGGAAAMGVLVALGSGVWPRGSANPRSSATTGAALPSPSSTT